MGRLKDLKVTVGLNKKGLVKLNSDLRSMQGNFRRNFGAIQGLVKNAGRTLTASLTAPLIGVGAAAVKSAADLESLETSFISLTGGAKQASDMMQNLNRFTAKTPFQIEGVAKAARQLIASGTNVMEVNDQLQFLGDIAATSGSNIEDIAAIFSKVNAKGKVELENLNQLAERGIPIFDALAEATGLPADKLGAGAVSVEQFNKVLQSFAQEGGFASGAMERLSQTASGKLSTAIDNLKLAGAEMVKSLMPSIKRVLDGVTAMAQRFTSLSDSTKSAILVIGGVLAATGPLAMAVAGLMPIFAALTGPIGLVVLAIGAIVTAVIAFREEASGPLADVANYFIDIYNEVAPIRVAIAILVTHVRSSFKNIMLVLRTFWNYLKTINGALYALFVEFDFSKAKEVFSKGFQEIGEDIYDHAVELGEEYAEAIESGLKNRLERVRPEDISDALDFSKFLDFGGGVSVPVDVAPVVMSVTGGAGEVGLDEEELIDEPHIDALVTSYEKHMNRVKWATENVNQVMGTVGGAIDAVFANIKDKSQGFHLYMKQLLTDLLIRLTKLVATYAILSVLLGGATGMAQAGFKGGFKGFMMGGMGLVPQMAEGGLFSGSSLAMIGEGPGTSMINPEVVAPLDKLQRMMGGGAVTVTGRLDGRDLLISSERANFDRNRVRGF